MGDIKNYTITRTVECRGYKKTLCYPSYPASEVSILQNSYSCVELPDELSLPLRYHPHFQRILSFKPNCLSVPILGDYMEAVDLEYKLNEFLKQESITKFYESYYVTHKDMVIKFTLELERLCD